MMKKLMLGNEAVARGAYEAGVSVVSSYPGTPSTEITENIVKYDDIYVEWAPNEKVAAEVAIGASIAGARSMSCMKHVGLNVMADPVFTASYTGVNGGLVLCVADDQGMHSSQNEQDSRHYAKASKILMLEPSDSGECKEFTKTAYELSEKYDTPVFLRLSTRVSHSQSLVEEEEKQEVALKDYEKNPQKYVMMPGNAIKRHVVVEDRINALKEMAETSPLNRVEENGSKIGIIAGGIAYMYAKEALGDKADYLKIGIVYPLPEKKIKEFVSLADDPLDFLELPITMRKFASYRAPEIEAVLHHYLEDFVCEKDRTPKDSFQCRERCFTAIYGMRYYPSDKNLAFAADLIKNPDKDIKKAAENTYNYMLKKISKC